MRIVRILDELSAAQHTLDTASEKIIALTEKALSHTDDAEMTALLTQVLETCAFGDLVGQRLAFIAMAAREGGGYDRAIGHDPRPDAGLMNGPDAHGLKQDDVDILMRAPPPHA